MKIFCLLRLTVNLHLLLNKLQFLIFISFLFLFTTQHRETNAMCWKINSKSESDSRYNQNICILGYEKRRMYRLSGFWATVWIIFNQINEIGNYSRMFRFEWRIFFTKFAIRSARKYFGIRAACGKT